jgi:nicotinamidase-related amidase
MRVHLSYGALLALCFAPAAILTAAEPAAEHTVVLHTRNRVESPKGSGKFEVAEKEVRWDGRKTAVVICDMWDQHWCKGATARVAEMAARMNDLITAARRKGVLIIHCPSGTLAAYKDTPQRKLAQAAPPVKPKVPLKGWCNLDRSREPPLPIDDSDGGCDDQPQCKTYSAWKKQIGTLKIEPGDAITDSAEAYNLMQERGIDNLIIMGVHLNMCVLGRPFGIRQMVYQGKNVVLARDMTDTMYNSRRAPNVSHFRGTDLVIEHVEKYWCPTITSCDFLGGEPFRFKGDK